MSSVVKFPWSLPILISLRFAYFGCQGDGAEEPGQSCGGGQRVLRNDRPVLPAAPDTRRGYQRPRDSEAELGGHMEVFKPLMVSFIFVI